MTGILRKLISRSGRNNGSTCKFDEAPNSHSSAIGDQQLFAAMKHQLGMASSFKFSGAFGNCTEEDRVHLLALMSHSDIGTNDNSLSSDSSSGSSSCGSMHSLDGNESAASEADCYETIMKDMLLKDALRRCRPQENCNSKEEAVDSLYQRPFKCESVVAKLVDDEEPNGKFCIPPTDLKEKGGKENAGQEWVFTLYDFDGKGKVSKEDILSLVRSIYDVLGSAKLPIHPGGGKVSSPKSSDQPVGAFKIKLSVMPDLLSPLEGEKMTTHHHHHNSAYKTPMSKVVNDRKAPEVDQAPASGEAIKERLSRNNHYYDAFGNHQSAFKAGLRKNVNGQGVTAASPAAINTVGDGKCCNVCNQRDYVNLSELENCCRERHSCATSFVHRIRHCDRHCHCPPIVHRNLATTSQCYRRFKRTCNNEAEYLGIAAGRLHCCRNGGDECNSVRLGKLFTVDKKVPPAQPPPPPPPRTVVDKSLMWNKKFLDGSKKTVPGRNGPATNGGKALFRRNGKGAAYKQMEHRPLTGVEQQCLQNGSRVYERFARTPCSSSNNNNNNNNLDAPVEHHYEAQYQHRHFHEHHHHYYYNC